MGNSSVQLFHILLFSDLNLSTQGDRGWSQGGTCKTETDLKREANLPFRSLPPAAEPEDRPQKHLKGMNTVRVAQAIPEGFRIDKLTPFKVMD